MGAACCAGSALAGGGAAGSAGGLTSPDNILVLPLAMYELAPRATVFLFTALLLSGSLGYILLVALTPESVPPTKTELSYLSTSSPSRAQPLPSIRDAATVQLSVVVPAYNERDRLPGMLRDAVQWLERVRQQRRSLVQGPEEAAASDDLVGSSGQRSAASVDEEAALTDPLTTYEIIVVDDGSKDGTLDVALETAGQLGLAEGAEVRAVRLERNRGKGGAVRHGVLHARGSLILFADADGATRFGDLSNLCVEMRRILTPARHGIVVGSRAHMVKSEAVVKRSFVRNLLMHLFHIFLTLLLHPPSPRLPSWPASLFQRRTTTTNPRCTDEDDGGKGTTTTTTVVKRRLARQPPIQDTQCGFKLFTRASSRLVFPLCHIDRWIFDVEILVLADLACRSSSRSIRSCRTTSTPSQPPAQQQGRGRRRNGDDDDDDDSEDVLLDLALPVAEVAVDWREIGGSKIDLVKDSIGMALDLLVIRANYALGRWEAPVMP
ncbi:uncharacterized protein PFL1_02309 [Pseudozyma flocculosa PF-1]|uniref:dolichyl-phosphate beta-glucosyltransferase n=1 Tax=Pseudozyma flocculosa TaxID=84751 RepID=A0A5C3F6T1_9BASI|nr:uncharacterized protein PFL1_02309 [Pseudozyma flocculosa PF-1]EPQ30193.1 hypothetical protein PFL1_02309 [Pseudozyma flocculosa PF-1]SPO39880.1 related to dolichyl-phosphate beta-glucosyltransferase [Pseudozyma flocculosa]